MEPLLRMWALHATARTTRPAPTGSCQAWQRVDGLIAMARARDYDAAVTLLSDVREVNARKGRAGRFAQRISELRAAHASKPSLLARLRKAGF